MNKNNKKNQKCIYYLLFVIFANTNDIYIYILLL